MKFELTDREIEAIEEQGWRLLGVEEQGGCPYVEIENWSPAGEDLPETIWVEDGDTFATAVRRWANSFDKDEHVELLVEFRGKRGVPETIRDLCDDAEEIQRMFNDLADAIESIEAEVEDGKIREYRIPVKQQRWGHVWVKAKSKNEAIKHALSPACEILEYGWLYDQKELDNEIDIEVNESELDKDEES